MTTIAKAALVREIKARAAGRERMLVAIAGPPGSGKSTIAAELAAQLGPSAAVLPMDGYHLDNDRLRQLGLYHRKGAPETFDAAGFVSLLLDVRSKQVVSFPTFDRAADTAVPDTGRVEKDTRIVLVEGNYLLLKTAPWSDLAALFDMTVGLEVNREELEARLIARWVGHGLSPVEARRRALDNDMRNADFILENSFAPDFTLQTGEGQTSEPRRNPAST